jgi:DHA1 family bicyclomycin/chloramphenicol resistance-like MFS transporter
MAVTADRAITKIRFGEFVALSAATMATQALAVDAMLPALPIILRALNVADANLGQWIVTAYMTGLSFGQLFWGIMSDRFGRRRILLTGLSMYVVAAFVCTLAGSFQTLLAWRFVHGIAAACTTVIRSAVRDQYSGRQMARVVSLTFVVFIMVPIIAPSVGQGILWLAPWRFIFAVFGMFAGTVAVWLAIRLPETLHPEYRMTLTREHIVSALRLVLGDRASLFYTLAVMLMFGSLIAYVGTVQQIFTVTFQRPSLMPTMFALCAILMGAAAYGNSRIVERLGMRRISHAALLVFIGVALLHTVVAAMGLEQIWTFVVFQSLTMATFSLSVSNFGAMAMEPVGSVAGVAASLQGFISTFFGALIAAFIGKQFNGTTLPLSAGALICGACALICVLVAENGRLFAPHHAGENAALLLH